jgi:hypothetical protein
MNCEAQQRHEADKARLVPERALVSLRSRGSGARALQLYARCSADGDASS